MYKVKLNPDAFLVSRLKEDIKNNDGYCPCRVDKRPEFKCPCEEFKAQSHGMCHCGLYIKENVDEDCIQKAE